MPDDAKSSGRKFPCPKCAARLDFDPADQVLACPYCGYEEAIALSTDAVEEQDFEATVARLAETKGLVGLLGHSQQIRCPGCGAVVLLEDNVVTDRCPFCVTHLSNEPENAEGLILPESVLPFAIEDRKARGAFDGWLSNLWFAPGPLKQLANLGQLNGVYLPYWTYDALTDNFYRGQRGDRVQYQERYTENVNGQEETRSRTITRVDWSFASGRVQHFFNDILICGSKGVPPHLIGRLARWDLDKLERFRSEFLSGFRTERYAVDLGEGYRAAQGAMDGHIRQLCRQDIGGDEQRLDDLKTHYHAVTFKHLLLPVWLASYRYHDKVFQIIVNARTGDIVGDRPYSVAKILALVFGVLGGMLVFMLLMMLIFKR